LLIWINCNVFLKNIYIYYKHQCHNLLIYAHHLWFPHMAYSFYPEEQLLSLSFLTNIIKLLPIQMVVIVVYIQGLHGSPLYVISSFGRSENSKVQYLHTIKHNQEICQLTSWADCILIYHSNAHIGWFEWRTSHFFSKCSGHDAYLGFSVKHGILHGFIPKLNSNMKVFSHLLVLPSSTKIP
jgi:hypothetical protein